MELTSAHNPRLLEVRKAARAGRPLGDGLVVAEGPHLLEEALGSSWHVETVFATAAACERFARFLDRADFEVVRVSERALQTLASTETSQGVVALLRPKVWRSEELFRDPALVVVLDAIQDPGNAGAIVRSAEAFGASGVVFGEGSVRVANGKLLRAAAGSLFRMPFVENRPAAEVIDAMRTRNIPIFGLSARDGQRIDEADLRGGCALAVGNEGAGLSRELREAAGIWIPTERVESLNAAIACSIALFEAARQRSRA